MDEPRVVAVRVAVVGGGIAGLTAAWLVAGEHPECDVTVYESSGRVGGKLRVADLAGHRVDVGAEAMLVRRPEGVALAGHLGLDLVHPLTAAATIHAGGAAHRIPGSTVMGVPTSATAVAHLLTPATVRRIAAEPDQAPMPPRSSDIAVGAIVAERLGVEVVDRLVEPLLAGVYAGRPTQISLHAAIPALFRAVAGGGSLVAAARRTLPAVPATGPVFGSFAGGLGRLPEELLRAGRFDVETSMVVRTLRRTTTGFHLVGGPAPSPRRFDADVVILAVPPPAAARLLTDVAPQAAAELADIELASMAVISAAYLGVELPAGSGTLVAPSAGLTVKGVTITSQKWGGTPTGLTLLRASIGRAGETRDLQRTDGELAQLVRTDLRTLFGLTADPIDTLVTRWGGGLPQYGVGHTERVVRIRTDVARVPGLAVCGAAYDGVGVPACIGSAHAAVRQVAVAMAAAQVHPSQ